MRLQVADHAPLASLTTFGVAAQARRLVTLHDEHDLPAALAACAGFERRLVLGGGSNVLFAGDFDGAILRVCTSGRTVLAPQDHQGAEPPGHDEAVIEIQAGEPWEASVQWSLAQGLPGLENLSLIPGTAGAAAIQNIGAYGLELSERFESLRAVHLDTGETRVFDLAACRFGYRDSIFKQAGGQRWLILALRLRVGQCHRPVLGYAELRTRFPTEGPAPTAAQIAAAVRSIRAAKLPDPAVLGNAGSFFKNPIVSRTDAVRLREHAPALPMYPAEAQAPHTRADQAQTDTQAADTHADGAQATGAPLTERVKLSAGWLIERCGWKGHREGDAGVHRHHALVLVNHGAATGAQVLALAERIRLSVRERFGVTLEPEPLIVGGT